MGEVRDEMRLSQSDWIGLVSAKSLAGMPVKRATVGWLGAGKASVFINRTV